MSRCGALFTIPDSEKDNTMRYLFIGAVLTATCVLSTLTAAPHSRNDDQKISLSDLPKLQEFKADPYLRAAALLQKSGKEKAFISLADLAKAEDKDDSECGRAILLCRMLFKAKPNGEFRRPAIGVPVLFGSTKTHDWPLEPIELVDGVPFVVVSGYRLGGLPELSSHYVDYCIRNCDWNTEEFKPKTAEEKRKALEKLLASSRWEKPLTEEDKKELSKKWSSQID